MYYFTSCLIGGSDDPNSSDKTCRAYANDMHHGIPKFSFVSVSGEEDNGRKAIWYCRIIAFIKLVLQPNGSESKDIHEVAYVEYLRRSEGNSLDVLTKCTKLKWETRPKRFKIIEIANIMKIVNVVPNFKGNDCRESGEFFLNSYLFD